MYMLCNMYLCVCVKSLALTQASQGPCNGIMAAWWDLASDSDLFQIQFSVELIAFWPNHPQSLQISFCQKVMILSLIGANSGVFFW